LRESEKNRFALSSPLWYSVVLLLNYFRICWEHFCAPH
jgi:hypothetical protein